jgi:hypothetical protein
MNLNACCAKFISNFNFNENTDQNIHEEYLKTCGIASIFIFMLLLYVYKFLPKYREFINHLKHDISIDCKCKLCAEVRIINQNIQNSN